MACATPPAGVVQLTTELAGGGWVSIMPPNDEEGQTPQRRQRLFTEAATDDKRVLHASISMPRVTDRLLIQAA